MKKNSSTNFKLPQSNHDILSQPASIHHLHSRFLAAPPFTTSTLHKLRRSPLFWATVHSVSVHHSSPTASVRFLVATSSAMKVFFMCIGNPKTNGFCSFTLIGKFKIKLIVIQYDKCAI